MKILLVQAERQMRDLLQSLLNGWGYEVVTAIHTKKALQLLQEQSDLRLVILDWMIHEEETLDVCRFITEKRHQSYIYSIFLTSSNNKEDILACLKAGADDYMPKPFHHEELHFRIQAGERILELERKLKDAYEEMRRLATFDSLTGLWNRRIVLEQMEKDWIRVRRESRPLSIVLADVDHFKQVNDLHGHAVGDQVLVHISKKFRESIRPYDAIGRYGGEEFLFCFPDCDEQEGYKIAERLRRQLENHPLTESDRCLSVTASFGGTTFYPKMASYTLDRLLRIADDALYQAKRQGKNKVVWIMAK